MQTIVGNMYPEHVVEGCLHSSLTSRHTRSPVTPSSCNTGLLHIAATCVVVNSFEAVTSHECICMFSVIIRICECPTSITLRADNAGSVASKAYHATFIAKRSVSFLDNDVSSVCLPIQLLVV